MKMQITHGLVTWPIRHDLIISEIFLPNDFAHHSKTSLHKSVTAEQKERGQAHLPNLELIRVGG
jgi:hypothetical protein